MASFRPRRHIHGTFYPQEIITSVRRGHPVPDFGQLKSADARRRATATLTTHVLIKLWHTAEQRSNSEGRRYSSHGLKGITVRPKRTSNKRRLLQRSISEPRVFGNVRTPGYFSMETRWHGIIFLNEPKNVVDSNTFEIKRNWS